jgi:ATP-binding cassette, subfamily B, bacterial PglK
MNTNLFDLFKYVPDRKKSKLFLLLILLLVGVIFEGLSFAIFIPGLDLIINNNFSYLYKLNIDKIFDFKKFEIEELISFFLMFTVIIFFIKNFYLLFLQFFKNKLFKQINTLNAVKLFDNYLELDWEEHLKKNSAEIIRNVQNEIQKITITINAVLELVTELLVFSVILFFLSLWNATIVLTLIVIFGTVGFIFVFIFKKRINHWAQQIQDNESAFFKNIKESIGSIKEIKILGKTNLFIDELKSRLLKSQSSRLRFETMQQSPRFFLEFTSVLSICLLTIYFIHIDYGMDEILVNLGLIAVALFRIMPSTNRIMKNINDIRFGMNSVRIIEKEHEIFNKITKDNINRINFEKNIELCNINYSYGVGEKNIFTNLNLTIKKNSIIGIIGSSGSGKTTFIDILTGLILKKEGHLKQDGIKIDKSNVKSYQRNFGYIPQNFYLFDNTIRENIAINENNLKKQSTEKDDIILKILNQLQLKKILTNKGLDTQVGENALRLSGGQRQRLGIARILFHNKDILIFDEATNALDKETEKDIFDFIYSLKRKKTIIISTHSVDMLYGCDEIFQIKNNSLNKIK